MISAFFCKISTFTKSNSVRAVLRHFFLLFSVQFFINKTLLLWSYWQVWLLISYFSIIEFYRHCVRSPASGFLRIGHKLVVVLFLLSILVTGTSFMSISSLVLELWQFPSTRNLLEFRKSEISLSEFCLISRGWDEAGIPNLACMSLMSYRF